MRVALQSLSFESGANRAGIYFSVKKYLDELKGKVDYTLMSWRKKINEDFNKYKFVKTDLDIEDALKANLTKKLLFDNLIKDIDIIHFTNSTSFYTKKKSVVTYHDNFLSALVRNPDKKSQESITQGLVNSSVILCITENSKRMLLSETKGRSLKDVRVIYPFFKKQKTSFSKKFYDTIEPNSGVVIGLTSRKNIFYTVKEFLEQKNIKYLYLIGTINSELNPVFNILKGNERVKWLGYLPENYKYAVIKKCRVGIFMSPSEGFGYPLVEFVNEGIRPIVADAPVFREIGRDYVEYCKLKKGSLTTALKKYNFSKNNDISDFFEMFSKEKTTDKILEVYKELSK